jgi:hypothetical protein
MVPNGAAPGRAALAIGEPRGDTAGTALSGGVHIYQVHAAAAPLDGIDTAPVAIVVGESNRSSGQIGEFLSGGTGAAGGALFVGGTWGNAVALDAGSAWLVDLTP